MDLRRLLLSFSGRISRKTYILAVAALSVVMFVVMLAGVALVTGDPFASVFWTFSPENISVWGPIYAGVILIWFWPGLALTTKRLHDRSYPMWVGLAFYLGMLVATGVLLWFGQVTFDFANAPKPSQEYMLVTTLVLWPISMWFVAQTMFMRGVPGPNAFGPDPLAGYPLPGYEPRTFWNVVFNPDGRMGRSTWWLIFGSLCVLFVIWAVVYGVITYSAMSRLPQSDNSAWLASPEGQHAIMRAALPGIIVMTLLLYVLLWSGLAAGTKRLHDRGRSGWTLAAYYVPFALFAIAGSVLKDSGPPDGPARWMMIAAGVIWAGLSLWLLVEMGFLKGQQGENNYGPDPSAT